MTARTVSGVHRGLAFIAFLMCFAPKSSDAQVGLSARYSNQVATIGESLDVRLEIDDPTGVVQTVVVELRRALSEPWIQRQATRGDDGWWAATFTSTTVWNAGGTDVRQPEILLSRAILRGARGGAVLRLGFLDPFELDVLAPAEAKARARVMLAKSQVEPEDGRFQLTGYVGVEGRLGSSARARAWIGAGGSPSARSEVGAAVTVGPSFAEPDSITGGGPLVLGFELYTKFYSRNFENAPWSLFLRPDLRVDLRLPGVDPGAGLAAGFQFWVGPEIGLVVSLGGAAMAIAPPATGGSRKLGFSGGLRTALRFGPAREDP